MSANSQEPFAYDKDMLVTKFGSHADRAVNSEFYRTMSEKRIRDGEDAVFLPGKIHGCEHQIYVVYLNAQSDAGKGSFEMEILDVDGILLAYKLAKGRTEEFFELLPDLYQGCWCYCSGGTPEFEFMKSAFFDADFIQNLDGDMHDEMVFLVGWAIANR